MYLNCTMMHGLTNFKLKCEIMRKTETTSAVSVQQLHVLTQPSGPKSEEVKRRPDSGNEELYDLYSSLNSTREIKSRRMRWSMHRANTVEEIDALRGMGGQKTAGRPSCKWEDNTRVDFK